MIGDSHQTKLFTYQIVDQVFERFNHYEPELAEAPIPHTRNASAPASRAI
jgi:hypothetical protein